ncbi:Hypothetical predicted protein, partial [Mytilus galloprovincialis]
MEPSQTMEFLGYTVNSKLLTLSLPKEKVEKIKKQFKINARTQESVSKRFSSVDRSVNSNQSSCPSRSSALSQFTNIENKSPAFGGPLRSPNPVKRGSSERVALVGNQAGVLERESVTKTRTPFNHSVGCKSVGMGSNMSTDKYRWALDRRGKIPPYKSTRTKSSNVRSTILCQKSTKQAYSYTNGQHNSNCICKQNGGNGVKKTKFPNKSVLGLVSSKAINNHCGLYIPGKSNVIADWESRHYADFSNWRLSPILFKSLMKRIGPCNVDLFADRSNTHLNQYFSWKPDPQAKAVDALLQSWREIKGYAFPPFCLISTCLAKVREENSQIILITPVWQSQAWYPLLLQMSVDYPVLLPMSHNTVLSPMKEPHPLILNKTLKLAGSTKKPFKGLSSQTVGNWIKWVMKEEAGIDISLFQAHSCRMVSTSKAAMSGISMDDIMSMADWSNTRTFNKFYFRTNEKAGFADKVLEMPEVYDVTYGHAQYASFPTTLVTVAVQAELFEGSSLPIPGYDPTPSLLPIFRCKFDEQPNGTYIYDIYWYINEFEIKSYTNIPMKDMNTTLLKHTDWIDTNTMNMEPEKYDYTVNEGDSITIKFKSTVPVGCIASHKSLLAHCDQSFSVFQPGKNSNVGSCSNNIAIKDIIFKAQFCGIKIGATDWQEEKKLEVYGFSDGLYNSADRLTYIRLSTSAVSKFNELWTNVQIPDIKVKVLDRDALMTNRLCQSVNDPHITTFDGKYYHFMDIGEFVIYRNDRGPYWVHALLTNCGFGWQGSACHCAIAIRSRSSLFVIRTCKSISRTKKELLTTPVTKLISCDNNDLQIDFNQARNEYKVTLPIGTEIKISISRWSGFIGTVTVKPSIYDINEAKGLCGVPSVTKDPSDDYTHRYNGPVSSDQEFAKSWRITSAITNEKLFVDEPNFIKDDLILNLPNNQASINNSTTFCTCEDQASSIDSLDDFNILQCNLTESTAFCSSSQQSGNQINSYSTSCTISKRKRRSLDHSSVVGRITADTDDSDDVTESQPLVFDEDINSTDVISQTFRNGWTAETAYQTCQEALTTAIPSDVYSDVVEVDVENFIQSCVSDIE